MAENKEEYAKDFSEQGFWGKLAGFAKAAGKEVIGKALQLYYALQEKETPTWAKTIIVAALGYFISPLDAIPDLTPVVGYADDVGVLAMAVSTVAMYITDDVKAKAEEKLAEWFGN